MADNTDTILSEQFCELPHDPFNTYCSEARTCPMRFYYLDQISTNDIVDSLVKEGSERVIGYILRFGSETSYDISHPDPCSHRLLRVRANGIDVLKRDLAQWVDFLKDLSIDQRSRYELLRMAIPSNNNGNEC